MKRAIILLACIAASGNAYSEAQNQTPTTDDVYLACEQKFQMGPEENRNFLVYLDLREMTALIEKGVNYYVCDVAKASTYYALACSPNVVDRPFSIDRKTLEANGRFLEGTRAGTARSYKCEKLPVPTDLQI